MHHHMPAQHAIEAATQIETVVRQIESTRLPSWKETTCDPIPNTPLRHTGAHGKDGPGSIGRGYATIDGTASHIFPGHQVPIIERNTLDPNENIAIPKFLWTLYRLLADLQVESGFLFSIEPGGGHRHRSKTSENGAEVGLWFKSPRIDFVGKKSTGRT